MLEHALRSFGGLPPIPITVLIGLVALQLVTLVHETGHGVAAALLLPEGATVSIGREPTALVTSVGRLDFRASSLLRGWSTGSRCEYRQPQERRDAVLIALAGPAASLLSALLAYAAMQALDGTVLRGVFEVVALISLFSCVFSLVPMTISSHRKVVWHTDGKHIVAALQGRSLAPGLRI